MSTIESGTPPEGLAVAPAPPHHLSHRETQILALIVQGLSNQEIAEATLLSINSVKTYIRTAYRKLGVAGRSEAVAWAVQHGLGQHGLRPRDPGDEE